jgi:hypothetical protein
MAWKLSYLENVEEWLDRLSKPQLQSIAKEIKLLGVCGNQLRLPHSKSLGAHLFELRERRFGLRLYYCFRLNKELLVLLAVDKTSQKQDIRTARQLLKRYQRG